MTYLNDLMFRAAVVALFLLAPGTSTIAQPLYRSGDVPKQAANNGITVGENFQVSVADKNIAIGEFLVAAHPADPNVLLACANVFSSETNRMWVTAYRSADSGVVWTRVLETATPGLGNDGDPSCTFGPDGNVYVATIAMPQYGDFTSPFYAKLFRSSDDGVKWTQAAALPLKWQGFDREFLVVDNTGGPNDGALYMNATTFVTELGQSSSRQSGIGLWVSRDEGRTFSAPIVGVTARDRFVFPNANSVVLSDGTVVMLFGELNNRSTTGERLPNVWNAPGQPVARLRILMSPPGGESLSAPIAVADDYMPPSSKGTTQIPYLAVDPGTGPFKDRLYVVWPDERSGRSEILLSYSADKGRTWSSPIVVNDDRRKAIGGSVGPDHFLPVVAVNRQGVVGVMWHDRRDVVDGMGWDLRFTASLDGGETFLPSVPVSTVPIRFPKDLRLATFGFVDNRKDGSQGRELQVSVEFHQLYAADTAGMAADASGTFHPMWIDHRTGSPQLWTASVNVNGKGVRNGSPALASLDDVSSAVTMEVQSTAYDQKTRDVAVTVALKNTSTQPIRLPLTLRLIRMTSDMAESVEVLDADNQVAGLGALWQYNDTASGRQLKPNMTTTPRVLHFRLSNDVSFRTDAGYKYGLVRMQARILAASGP